MTSAAIPGLAAPPARKLRLRRRIDLVPLAALLAGGLVWEVLARLLDSSFFPPFSEVFGEFGQVIEEGDAVSALLDSLGSLGFAMLAAVVVGVLVGAAMGTSEIVRITLEPFVNVLFTAPAIVFAPVYFAIFGLSRWTIFALIFQYAVFVVIVNTCAGIEQTDREMIEMAHSFGASGLQTTFLVRLPASLPLTMAGIRLGTGRAVKGMINGEMFIAFTGIGAMIMAAGGSFNAARVLALLLMITIVALILGWVVTTLDRRVTRWLVTTHR
jgi:ABC-type nitrate/sulfonate/bicarbonate transport system permease component